MKSLIKIAWRNIWRNKLRSISIMLAVFLGLLAGIFASALVDGMLLSRFTNFIENKISHIQIHHPDYIGQGEVYQTSMLSYTILDKIKQTQGVKAATIRTKTGSMIASATFTGGVEMIGIDSENEHATTQFASNIVEGNFIENEDKNEIVIGKALAEKMKVGIGSRIVLTFQDKNSEIVSAAFHVKGLYETNYKRYDESTVFSNIYYLNNLLQIGEEFHEIAILGKEIDNLNMLISSLPKELSHLSIRKWNELSPELEYWVEIGGVFSYIFIILIMIGLAFGLLNTMLMAVFERTREIGMLMAIGMNKTKMFGMIVLETLALSTIGALSGMISGYLLVTYFSTQGIDFSAFNDVMREIGFDYMVYPNLDENFFVILPIIVILTALISAIYPAIKALKLNPAEAVRK